LRSSHRFSHLISTFGGGVVGSVWSACKILLTDLTIYFGRGGIIISSNVLIYVFRASSWALSSF
jgi:hypothetical protein